MTFKLKLRYITFLFCYSIALASLGQSRRIPPLSLNPEKPLSQYIIDNWTAEEGLPSKTLTSVLQTADGYLWIASYNGLYRFDGVNFKPFTKEEYAILRTNSFTALAEGADNTLFLGTGGSGLIAYRNGKFEAWGGKQDFNKPIEAIGIDSEKGQVWAGTRGGGVFIFEKDTFWQFKEQPLIDKISVSAIVEAKNGQKWFATEGNGVVMLENGNAKNYNMVRGLASNQVLDIFIDSKQTVWIGTTHGVNYITQSGEVEILKGTENYPINTIIEDIHGSIWIASTRGLFRLNGLNNQLEFLSENQGLPHQNIIDLTIDREGSLWLATYRAGLARFKDSRFENYTILNGLQSPSVNAVAQLNNEKIILATGSGELDLIENHTIKPLKINTFLPNNRIKHINQNTQGDILLSTYSGLLVLGRDGKETLFDAKKGFPDNQARVSLEDTEGNIWVGTRAGGVAKVNLKNAQIEVFDRSNGLSSNFIMAIEQDKQGNLYFGLNGAGLDVKKIDGSIKNYGIDVLGSNLVFNVHIDQQQNIWVATNAGLARIQPDGIIHRFTTQEGLASDIIFDILEDNEQNLWLTSSEGVFSILKSEFNEVIAKQKNQLECRVYGKQDGMAEQECTGATQSLVGSDGNLYIPTLGGLSIFEPSYKMPEMPNPPVYVNQMIVDGELIDLSKQEIILPADAKRIALNYTALNLTAPKNIRFQYKLKGYEDWIDAGTGRQAIYTNISAGQHEFLVRAIKNNEKWNDEVMVSFSFYRTPKFYENVWFYIISALLLISLGFALYQYRIKSIKRKNKELEGLVAQRTAQISKQKDKLELAYNDIRTVSSIGQEVTSVLDVATLIQTVYENIKTLMSTDIFGIAIYDDIRKHLEFRNFIRQEQVLPSHIELLKDEFYLSVQCFIKNEPIFMNAVSEEYQDLEVYLRTLKRKREEESESVIFVPLVIDNKPIGILTVQSFTQEAYKDQHLTILQALASYISVALENSRIYQEINSKNHQITNSIRYAETIQQAVLPSEEKMNEALHEYFTIFRPKDIVSGDFYWFSHQGDKIFLATVDCTGHGVPGAFMSMIGSALLNEIVNVEQITSPAEILERLHTDIRLSLKQETTGNTDGMDVLLCVLEPAEGFQTKLTFAGAKRHLYFGQKGKLLELKGTNKAIGGFQKNKLKVFENQEIFLNAGDTLYLTTDGLVDQHSPEGRRFGTKRLKELLQDCLSLDLDGQQAILLKALQGHQKLQEQRDDITVIGVRV